ncbi:MAG: hypothetical protein WD845_15230 [Pirellulales bacterium]
MRLLNTPRMLCAVATLLLVVSGCGQQLYRAETKLFADGQVRRAIYQPIEDTPLEALAPAAWTGVTYAVEIAPDAWHGTIDQLPSAQRDKDTAYFAAWGQFASPAKLPSTYVKLAPRGLPNGKLVVDYRQTDHVFVTEYDWRETLTDIVTLDDMHRSRRQFLEVVIPVVRKCLETALGPEYDVENLVAWFDTTGSDWFVELTDAFFEAGTRDQLPPNREWKATMADVCARYGLKLRDTSGRLLDDDQARQQLAEFAAGILRQQLKRRDGAPIPQSVVDDLLEWVNLIDPPQSKNPRLARLDGLAQQVVAEQFGSQQNFADVITPLGTRMLGLYRVEILGPPRRFHYEMEMPGAIVETNGLLLGENRLEWSFEAVQAYPFGYAMHGRALAPSSASQRELLGGEPLSSRADMLAFVAAVNSDFMVAEAVRNSAKRKTMSPLYEARERTVSEGGNTRLFDTVLRVLGLPAQEAPPAK